MHIGDLLADRFQLRARVSQGRHGDLWRAQDTANNRDVALKVLRIEPADGEDVSADLRRHADTLTLVRHPGVVDVVEYVDAVDSDGSTLACLATDYLEATPLSQLPRPDNRMDVESVLPIVMQTAEALHAAHEAGLVHGDVSADHILMRGDESVTLVGFTAPQPDRAAEQPQDDEKAPGGAAEDVRALSAVAYRLLSGRDPAAAGLPSEPLPADVPAAVSSLVMRGLATGPGPHPRPRLTSAANMADLVCRVIADQSRRPVDASAATPAGDDSESTEQPDLAAYAAPAAPQPDEDDAPRPRRRRLWFGVVAAVAILCVAAVAHQSWPASLTPDSARSASAAGATLLPDSDDDEAVHSPDSVPSVDAETPNSASPDDTGNESGSADTEPSQTPSDDPSSSPDPEVPEVVGMDRLEAETALEEAGFSVEVDYEGAGSEECPVHAQDPDASSTHPDGATVTISVKKRFIVCT